MIYLNTVKVGVGLFHLLLAEQRRDLILVSMRVSQKINLHCLHLGYLLLASGMSCRHCGLFCTVFLSAVRRWYCGIAILS
jgi:hypothetical protein